MRLDLFDQIAEHQDLTHVIVLTYGADVIVEESWNAKGCFSVDEQVWKGDGVRGLRRKTDYQIWPL